MSDRQIFAGEIELGKLNGEKATHARSPKLPYFEKSKDKMDSYLSRFENKLDKSLWATYLIALLKGRALEVYDRLLVEYSADYDKLKYAFLRNFDMTMMTERGFKRNSVMIGLKGKIPLFSSVVDCAII